MTAAITLVAVLTICATFVLVLWEIDEFELLVTVGDLFTWAGIPDLPDPGIPEVGSRAWKAYRREQERQDRAQRHRDCLLRTAELETVLFGTIVSESVRDECHLYLAEQEHRRWMS